MGLVVVFLVVAAALVAVLVLRVVARRRRDEIRSIHHYHDRLDTLHVVPHDRGGSVRLVAGEPVVPPPIEPDRPRLDPEAAKIDPSLPPMSRAERIAAGRHGSEWALDRSQPRARVDNATTLVIVAVIGVLLALALAGFLIQRDHPPTTTVPPTTVHTSTTTTTTTR